MTQTMTTVTCKICGKDKLITLGSFNRRKKFVGKVNFYHKDCYLPNASWNNRGEREQ